MLEKHTRTRVHQHHAHTRSHTHTHTHTHVDSELIKTIMRYLGILDDQPVDEASAKAGGYMNPGVLDSLPL